MKQRMLMILVALICVIVVSVISRGEQQAPVNEMPGEVSKIPIGEETTPEDILGLIDRAIVSNLKVEQFLRQIEETNQISFMLLENHRSVDAPVSSKFDLRGLRTVIRKAAVNQPSLGEFSSRLDKQGIGLVFLNDSVDRTSRDNHGILPSAAACLSSNACLGYDSRGSWSNYQDCGDPFCSGFCRTGFFTIDGPPPVNDGPATRQKSYRYRATFNQYGQQCTEIQLSTRIVDCGNCP